jgi:hypothetical protein
MDNVQVQGVPAVQASAPSAGLPTSQPEVSRPAVIPAQCPSCQAGTQIPQPVSNPVPNQMAYVVCDVDPVYPDLGVEKYALMKMKMEKVDFKATSKEKALQLVLEHYPDLARQMCYVALVQEAQTYLLMAKFPDIGYPMLVEAAKSEISAVIGTVGPTASPDMCNGLTLPILFFDTIFNFDKKAFIAQIPVPHGVDKDNFRKAADDLWDQLVPLIGLGTGTSRALAHLIFSDEGLWLLAVTQQLNHGAELKSLETQLAPATATTLVNVKATFLYRDNLIEKTFFKIVDVSNMFPVTLGPWRQWIGSTA